MLTTVGEQGGPGAWIPRDRLDAQPWAAHVLDSLGRIVAVNAAWDRQPSGPRAAEVLGTDWLSHISGAESQEWHRALLARVLQSHHPVGPLPCECNTPTRFRLFATTGLPLVTSDGSRAAALLTELIAEGPIARHHACGKFDPDRYVDPDGVILQCCGCRRARALGTPVTWTFIPELLLAPHEQNISHGLCERCRRVYYGALAPTTSP